MRRRDRHDVWTYLASQEIRVRDLERRVHALEHDIPQAPRHDTTAMPDLATLGIIDYTRETP